MRIFLADHTPWLPFGQPELYQVLAWRWQVTLCTWDLLLFGDCPMMTLREAGSKLSGKLPTRESIHTQTAVASNLLIWNMMATLRSFWSARLPYTLVLSVFIIAILSIPKGEVFVIFTKSPTIYQVLLNFFPFHRRVYKMLGLPVWRWPFMCRPVW